MDRPCPAQPLRRPSQLAEAIMTNDTTQQFRIEVQRPDGKIDCYPCLHPEQIGELLSAIIEAGEAAIGTLIHVYDHQAWRPGLSNHPFCKFQAL